MDAQLKHVLLLATVGCRHLAEAPANLCTPEYLVQAAQSIAAAAPDVLKVQVLDVANCTELGMGCYLAVGAASANSPRFIHLTYSHGGRRSHLPTIARRCKVLCSFLHKS